MVIQKIHPKNLSCSRICLPYNGKGKETADNPVIGTGSGNDSDDSDGCEVMEPSCELGMVEGELFGIPYELYDLPDLREILSLETWNSCLTEEERFVLTAHLPDMDQHTFNMTMKELFDGSNINFGNPSDMFFKRLKAGYYPPNVVCLREGLQFLQRKKYYHSLRSYHDQMVEMFLDMKRVWDQCGKGVGLDKRIAMWTERRNRNQHCLNLLDLNKFPKDDHLLGEELHLQAKKEKGVAEYKRVKDISSSLTANGKNFIVPNCKPKGVLKKKASGNGSLLTHSTKKFTGAVLVPSQSAPKGVLKIVPKVPPVKLERSEVVSRAAQPTSRVRTGLQDLNFSLMPASLQFVDAKGLHESSFHMQKVDGNRFYSTLGQPPCLLNQQESTIGTDMHPDFFTRKMKAGKAASLDDVGISVLGKRKLFGNEVGRDPHKVHESMDSIVARRFPFSGEILRPDFVTGIKDFSLESLESYPFGIPYHRRGRHLVLAKKEPLGNYSGIADMAPRISDVGIGKHENLVSSSSDHLRGNESVPPPLTYKRRKALSKANSLDIDDDRLPSM